MMGRLPILLLLLAGVALFAGGKLLPAGGEAERGPHRDYVPLVASNPPPTPTPLPYYGDVVSIRLASAQIWGGDPVENRDTEWRGANHVFQDPSHPAYIAWYKNFGMPGWGANNSIFAAHVDYVNYRHATPFAHLAQAQVNDFVYVTMDNGIEYAYQVQSVRIAPLNDLDWGNTVWPTLPPNMERVTLITCGGGFVPNPSGIGGSYNSRVILVAERYVYWP
jgi:hypothetical protein